MKKLLFILLMILVSTYYAGKEYNYVNNRCYIYKFVDSTDIRFITRYNNYLTVKVDTNEYKYLKQHRKDYYNIRTWDDGRILLLKDKWED